MSVLNSLTVLATAAATLASAESKTYTVLIKNAWTANKFPTDYPSRSAHWSPMNVAVTNNLSGVISPLGGTASAGLQSMAETGSTATLTSELAANQNQASGAEVGSHKTMGMLVETGADPAKGELTFEVEADVTKFKYLELAAMIAPSPDWFGFVSLDLSMVNATSTVTGLAKGFDAGTKEGLTYTPLRSVMGSETVPKGTIQPLSYLNYLDFGNSNNFVFSVFVAEKAEENNTTAVPTAAPSAAGAVASLVTGAALFVSMVL